MKIGIELFGEVTFGKESSHNDMTVILNKEMAAVGYTMTPRLFNTIGELSPETFYVIRENILSTLRDIVGDNTTFRYLFAKFPYSTVDDYGKLTHRINACISRTKARQANELPCGHYTTDGDQTCSICLSSNAPLFEYASVTPLKPIDFVDDFTHRVDELVSRQSSLSRDEKDFVLLYGNSSTAVPDKVFKETLPLIYMIKGTDAVIDHISGATDIMRIAYLVSSPDADLSMKDNVRFKLSTRHKKNMLRLLEGTKNLEEDMMRNRERWLRLGEILKPARHRQFPNTALAFDNLRNNPKDIKTFGKVVERAVRSNDHSDEFFKKLKSRPAEFARRLDHLMRTTPDGDVLLQHFSEIAPMIRTDILTTLRKYFMSRDLLNQRVFFPKGQVNRAQIVPDNRLPLDSDLVTRFIKVMEQEVMDRFSKMKPLGRVYIDPALSDMVIPFNRRGDSSASTSVTKGSQYSFNGDVIRMFIWWQNGDHSHVDVDLSVIYMDENFNTNGHVAFTNLNNGNTVTHSGDITNAPSEAGASEFIDINIERLAQKSRYVAVSVNSYSGQKFSEFPCFAGFMERDGVRSGAVFEPASVAIKMDVSSENTAMIPMMFDLKKRKVIYADMASSHSRYSAVRNQSSKFEVMTRALVTLPERKPTYYEYAAFNALVRGVIVDSPEEADVVFDISNLDDIDLDVS